MTSCFEPPPLILGSAGLSLSHRAHPLARLWPASARLQVRTFTPLNPTCFFGSHALLNATTMHSCDVPPNRTHVLHTSTQHYKNGLKPNDTL